MIDGPTVRKALIRCRDVPVARPRTYVPSSATCAQEENRTSVRFSSATFLLDCDALGEVTRLVDVSTPRHGRIVGDEL